MRGDEKDPSTGWRSDSLTAVVLLLLLTPQAVVGWGATGHQLINQAAIRAAPTGPDGFPAFFSSPEAVAWLTYQRPEPDRWKAPSEYALRKAEGSNHYIKSGTACRAAVAAGPVHDPTPVPHGGDGPGPDADTRGAGRSL